MCLLIFIVLAYAGVSALAIWLLPQWLSIPLVVIIGIALLWVFWKIRQFIKKVKKALADVIPQEKLCSLAANENFKGHGFSFTFPVACEVSQTHFHDVEALMLKPKFELANAPQGTLMVVSTFPPGELKPKINATIEKIFGQLGGQASEPAPVEVGQLKGERTTFAVSKDGKDVQGEAVYLGDQNCSIVWVAIATKDGIAELATKYRELAVLIQRVEKTPPPAASGPVIDV